MYRMCAAARRLGRTSAAALVVALATLVPAFAQSQESLPAPTTDAAATLAPVFTADEIAELVAPIALYPDDLLAIVLPASTYPLQIVEAQRYREASATDSTRKPDDEWDDSVVALLNYPEALKLLNDDLDWTQRLGQAVLDQQPEVLAAIEGFRKQAHAAGNLKTDDKQVVEVSDDAVQIRPADPQVIYVPYYEPAAVTVYRSVPAYYYYPRPYPVYYYPYPEHYAFTSGFFWGVSTFYSLGWHSHHLHTYYPDYHYHPYYGRPYYYRSHYYRHGSWNGYRYRDHDDWRRHDYPRDGSGRYYDRNRWPNGTTTAGRDAIDTRWRPDYRRTGSRPGTDPRRWQDRDQQVVRAPDGAARPIPTPVPGGATGSGRQGDPADQGRGDPQGDQQQPVTQRPRDGQQNAGSQRPGADPQNAGSQRPNTGTQNPRGRPGGDPQEPRGQQRHRDGQTAQGQRPGSEQRPAQAQRPTQPRRPGADQQTAQNPRPINDQQSGSGAIVPSDSAPASPVPGPLGQNPRPASPASAPTRIPGDAPNRPVRDGQQRPSQPDRSQPARPQPGAGSRGGDPIERGAPAVPPRGIGQQLSLQQRLEAQRPNDPSSGLPVVRLSPQTDQARPAGTLAPRQPQTLQERPRTMDQQRRDALRSDRYTREASAPALQQRGASTASSQAREPRGIIQRETVGERSTFQQRPSAPRESVQRESFQRQPFQQESQRQQFERQQPARVDAPRQAMPRQEARSAPIRMETPANEVPRNMRIERSTPPETRSAPRAFERQSFQQDRQGGGRNNRGGNDQRGTAGGMNRQTGDAFRR
jgi:hypothetical protein